MWFSHPYLSLSLFSPSLFRLIIIFWFCFHFNQFQNGKKENNSSFVVHFVCLIVYKIILNLKLKKIWIWLNFEFFFFFFIFFTYIFLRMFQSFFFYTNKKWSFRFLSTHTHTHIYSSYPCVFTNKQTKKKFDEFLDQKKKQQTM